MRKRAGALYIKDCKLLLLCEDNENFFWTPGGGLEGAESFEEALERELLEELHAPIHYAQHYITIEDTEAAEDARYFLVDLSLPEKLPENVELHWYTKEDYIAGTPSISKRVYNMVCPQLIADGLL